jgi:hypothetical protein
MSGNQAFIVTGRTLLDWAFCGKMVPRDVVRLRCLFCRAPLTISAEAGRKIEEKRRDPEFEPAACGAACRRCVEKAAEIRGVAGIDTSAHGADLLEHNQNARDLVEFLMKRAR